MEQKSSKNIEQIAVEDGFEIRTGSPSPLAPAQPVPAVSAYIIYTSGSTGKPKGVVMSHASILNRLLWMISTYGWAHEDSTLQKTPLIFDASIWELFVPLLSGGRVVLARPGGQQDPAYLAQRIAEENISILQLVPSAVGAFLQHGSAARSKLKHLFCGGEALPTALVRSAHERLGVRVTNLYGPTEAAIDVASWDFAGSEDRPLLPIGRPISNTRLYVLNHDLLPAPIGAIGELYAYGHGLARGYQARPDLTAERFLPNPYALVPGERMYRTGDLARWLPNGALEFIGRADTQVKIRGFRIELSEIESALSDHPGIETAAVIHYKHLEGDDQLVGYAVPRPGFDISSASLRGWLLEQLPEHMVPSVFVLLSSIPRTPGGKLDRKALPQPVPERITKGPRPRTPIEQMVAMIWEEILHVEHVGIHESFFELGGHSLSVLQLLARVQESFNTQLPLQRVFDAPTIAELAETIAEASFQLETPRKPPLAPAPPGETKPLSFSQQRLWFLHCLEPESPAYNLATVTNLPPDVDLHVLERALGEVIRRHEILRAEFLEEDGVPVQRFRSEVKASINLIDLMAFPQNERWDTARRIAVDRVYLPFDLTRGQLFRADVLRLEPRESYLLFVMHHIVSDAWSVDVLRRELDHLYSAFLMNQPSQLPELEIQYSDYAFWQQSCLQGAVMDMQLSYWTQRLADAPPIVSLMPDHPRSPRQSYRGATSSIMLPLALADDLRQLSRLSSVTLFMTLLAAFKILLTRHGVGEDIVVGSHVANRDHVKTEKLIGFFVNSLVLRTDMSGDPAFGEVLSRVRETTLGAYSHQDLPFERLVEKIQPRRDMSITPLYQTAFDFQQSEQPLAADQPRPPLLSGNPTAKFDLNLTVRERPDGLVVIAEYCADLYDAGSIERLLRRYQVSLKSVIADPNRRIPEIELLDDTERAQLEAYARGRRAQYPIEFTLSQHFEQQAALAPDRIAAVSDADTITYFHLNREANRLAQLLLQGGFIPGQFAVVLAPRGLHFLAAALGILKAGGAYAPIDPEYPPSRVEYMVRNCGASALLTQSNLAAAFSPALAEIPGLRQVICFDSADGSSAEPVVTNTPRYWGRKDLARFSGDNGEIAVIHDPRSAAYVLYTSGSTGDPKAAIVRHDGAVNHIFAQIEELDLKDGFGFLQSAPCSSDISVWQMLAPLLAGGRTIFADTYLVSDPGRLLTLLQNERISIAEFVPGALRCLLDYLESGAVKNLELPALQWMMVTGEEVPATLLNRWLAIYPQIPLVNAYGPTEASDDVTQMVISDRLDEERGIASIGKPLPNLDCYIVDRNLQLVPAGAPGELCVSGIAVGEGYHGEARQTCLSFVPDPFSLPGKRMYRTGDLCRWTPNGTIEFLGRIDRQVKVRGFRIELGEVEAALRACPGIGECAAVTRGEAEEKQLVAYYLAREGSVIDPRELRRTLSQKLPEHLMPSAFAELEALPLTPGGKIDKKALASIRPSTAAGEIIPLTTANQRILAAIWAEVLRIDPEQIGAQADFFELGGHSLLGMLVVSRIRERIAIEIPLRRVFEFSSLERLAAQLDLLARDDLTAPPPTIRRSARELRRIPSQR